MNLFRRLRREPYLVGLTAILLAFLSVGLVLASAEGDHADGSAKLKDLLYRTLNFAVLAGILAYVLRKPIQKSLSARREGIEKELDGLEKEKRMVEKRLVEYKERLISLDKEAEKIISEYIREGEAVKAKIIEEAKVEAEKLQEQARLNIQQEFKKAEMKLREEIVEQAVAMAEDLIKRNINEEDQRRLVDEYIEKVVRIN